MSYHNDPRLTVVTTRLKEVDQEIMDFEWGLSEDDPEYLAKGPNVLQCLYLEREQLDWHLKQGTLYIPNF